MKKKKESYIDDGRTVANMNVDGFKWYESAKQAERRGRLQELKVTRKERRAMIKAALQSVLPAVLLYLLGFAAIFVLIAIWLR